MKKIVSFILAFGLLIHLSTAHAATTFTDVKHYVKEIEFLANKGIINGYKDGTFKPQNKLTRSQAVLMIMRDKAIEDYSVYPNPGFVDVPTTHPAYNEIAAAVHLGIVSGYETKGKKEFKPAANLTRAQMAKIMAISYGLQTNQKAHFKDVKAGNWSEPFIDALFFNQVTTGYPGHLFKPAEEITRLHFSLFMARHLNDDFKQPEQQPAPKPEPKPNPTPAPPKGDPTDGLYVIPGAPTQFKNCTALREYYPKGVQKGHPAYENRLDRDQDGWACEIN